MKRRPSEATESLQTAAGRVPATGMAIAMGYRVVDGNLMRVDARNLADLVTRMQQAFLDLPDLAMTVTEACARFDVEEGACEAVLDLLADAKVLTRRSDGAYVRLVRELATIHDVASRRPARLRLPRSVAFITPGELARLYQSRRVA